MLIKRHDHIAVFTLEGEIMFGNCLRIKENVKSWIEEKDTSFVFDVSKVPFMDSSGLGMLVSVLKMAAERGGTLVLAGPQQGIRRLFRMARLDQVIRLYDTVEEAIAGVSAKDNLEEKDDTVLM